MEPVRMEEVSEGRTERLYLSHLARLHFVRCVYMPPYLLWSHKIEHKSCYSLEIADVYVQCTQTAPVYQKHTQRSYMHLTRAIANSTQPNQIYSHTTA
jgi:hypothetical protein